LPFGALRVCTALALCVARHRAAARRDQHDQSQSAEKIYTKSLRIAGQNVHNAPGLTLHFPSIRST
jgi:hypothetical protein